MVRIGSVAQVIVWVLLGLAVAAVAVFVLPSTGNDLDDPAYDEVIGAEGDTETGPALQGSGRRAPSAGAGDAAGRFRIHGRVLDADGKPVAAVPIEVRRTGAARNPADPNSYIQPLEKRIRDGLERFSQPKGERGPIVAHARSSKDGVFTVALEASGKYELQALPAAPRIGTTATSSVHDGQPEQESDLYVLSGSALRGRVIDTADRPVSAVVSARWWKFDGGSSRTWHHAPTDTNPADGTFLLPAVPEGKVSITLALGNQRRISGISVKTPHEGEFVIRIDASGAGIGGTLTDAQNAPIADAVVLIHVNRKKDEAQAGGSTAVHAKTNAQGRYRIDDAPLGTVTQVQAAAEGFLALQQLANQAPAWKDAAVAAGKTLTLDLTLSRGGGVFGIVTEQGGNAPIEGVKVSLYPAARGNAMAASQIQTQATDAQGRYRFDAVALGRYVAIGAKSGWYPPILEPGANPTRGWRPDRMITPPDLTVVMTAEGNEFERNLEMARGLPVRGRVVDATGQGVARAEILARGYGLGQLAWGWGIQANSQASLARSADDGAFEIPGLPPQGAWVLYARKKGYAGDYAEAFALREDTGVPSIELKLLPGAVLRGRVVGLQGEDLGPAQVGFWGNNAELAADRSFKKLAPDGTFELTGLPPGNWTINLWMNGRQGTQKQITDLKAGEVREGIELEMAAGVEVSGHLVDGDGKPVPHQSLMLRSVGGNNNWLNGQTDEDGAFVFRGVKRGKVQLTIWGGSGGARPIGESFEAPASGLRITYERDPVVTIFGRVLGPDGDPIPLAQVRIRSASSGPGRRGEMMPGRQGVDVLNGAFRQTVSGKPPFEVAVRSPRDADGKPLNLLETGAKVTDPSKEVVIRMERGLEVRGVVVDAKGQGISGAPVRVGERTVRTGENGAFQILGLRPGKQYLFVGPVPGYASPPYQQVEAGDHSLRIALQPGLQIKGKVFDANGKPVAQGHVSASWKAAGSAKGGNASAQVQPGGSFTIDGVPAGVLVTLNVQVWNSGGGASFAPTQVDGVRPGADDIVVRLGSGLSIEGVVLMPDGKPATGCFVGANPSDGTNVHTGWTQIDEHGAWKISGLKPQKYDVKVMRQDGGPAPKPTPVEAPAAGVRITLPRAAALSGRVAGLSAAEVAQWRVRIWDEQGQSASSTALKADGTWRFPSLNGDVRYHIGVSKRGDERFAKTGPVDPGRDDIVLRMQQGRSISGVLDRSLAPEGNVWVSAESGGWKARAEYQENGGFVIRGLPPGAYDVSARSADGAKARKANVQAGAENVRLRLELPE